MRSDESHVRRLWRWFPPVVAAGFVMAGYFKSISALSFIPVDLTFGFAALTLVLVGHRLLTRTVPAGVHVVVVGFLVLLAAAAIFPPGTDYATTKVSRLFTLTLLAALAPIVLIRDRDDVSRFVWAWTGWCAVVVVSGLANPQKSASYEGAPVTAEGVNTIGLGMTAGLVFVVMVIGLIWKRVPWFVAVPGAACSVYVLLQSGSRGPLIAVIVTMIVAVLFVRSRPLAVRTGVVLALVGVGVYVAYDFAPLYAQERVADVLLRGQVSASANPRTGLYEIAVSSISTHPLGIGWGGFAKLSDPENRYPHSIVLESLTEAGLILGGLFLVWIVVCVWRARQASTNSTGALVFALVIFMLTMANSSGDINDNRTFFFALGIAIAAGGILPASSSRQDHGPPAADDAVEQLPAPVPAAGGRR